MLCDDLFLESCKSGVVVGEHQDLNSVVPKYLEFGTASLSVTTEGSSTHYLASSLRAVPIIEAIYIKISHYRL